MTTPSPSAEERAAKIEDALYSCADKQHRVERVADIIRQAESAAYRRGVEDAAMVAGNWERCDCGDWSHVQRLYKAIHALAKEAP